MLPRLLSNTMEFQQELHPLLYSLKETIAPLSTAAITLPPEERVPLRAFVEVFTASGSAGIYRVKAMRTDTNGVTELTLQHGLCTLADHMHAGESEENGTLQELARKLLSNQDRWVLGVCEVTVSDLSCTINDTNDLEGLLDLMRKAPDAYLEFDQSRKPWILNIRRLPTQIGCECRMDHNLCEYTIATDDAELCTAAYADDAQSPVISDKRGTWGLVERPVTPHRLALGNSNSNRIDAEEYLAQNDDPHATITLTALELSRLTGDPFDSFRLGMLCRCFLPDRELTQRIVSIEHPDPIGHPDGRVLTLASTWDDLGSTIGGLVINTRHINEWLGMTHKELLIEAERIVMLAQQIELKAGVDDLTRVQITLDGLTGELDMMATEIALRATKAEVDDLALRVSNAEISLNDALGVIDLKVSYTDFQSTFNEVSLTLDAMEDTIAAKADLILLDGYVKATALETEILNVVDSAYVGGILSGADIMCNALTANSSIWTEALSASDVTCTGLRINGSDAATQDWVQNKFDLIYAEGYATQSYVNQQISQAHENLNSVYATRDWVLGTATARLATTATTNALANRISALEALH